MLGLPCTRTVERGFVHKRLFKGLKGAIGGFLTGGPIGAFKGGVRGIVTGGGRAPAGCPPGFQRTIRGCESLRSSFRPSVSVVPGLQPIVQERDTSPGGTLGPKVCPKDHHWEVQADGSKVCVPDAFGEAVMGRFGAALEPEVMSMTTRRCPRGAVLGLDGLCYNKRDLRNNERFWPRGRRPLLTGGEMRCISIAASAAKKLQRKEKQLQAMGMLKKPTRRAAPKQLAAGHHAHQAHD